MHQTEAFVVFGGPVGCPEQIVRDGRDADLLPRAARIVQIHVNTHVAASGAVA